MIASPVSMLTYSSAETNVGSIRGTIINRQRIPTNGFLDAMDSYSSDLQYVGVSVFEPRYGRTKLQSLMNEGDHMEFDILYISNFHVESQYKANGAASDVGAYALRKVLYHPDIKGNSKHHDIWTVSCCVYILDPHEAMSDEERSTIEAEERSESDAMISAMIGGRSRIETEESLQRKETREQRLEVCVRLDANQFLRNGFIQDPALARVGGNSPQFMVAACGHWSGQLKTHAEAKAVQLYVAPPSPRPPVGKDSELLEMTKRICGQSNSSSNASGNNFLSMSAGVSIQQQPTAPDNPSQRVAEFQKEAQPLISQGGSLRRSYALHVACANNDPAIARCILQMDQSCLEVKDTESNTPLMIAAATAAGKQTNDGLPKDHAVIDLLLSFGAQKSVTNAKGSTAYDTFLAIHHEYRLMMQSLLGVPMSRFLPGRNELEAKLLPPGGPATADRSGSEGFVDYRIQDMEDAYLDGYDDNEDGDFGDY
mmetsp:Transcript_33190/g.80526  ORF Transcript_33190/g.80526 Transcript_33190/m.80526 type:complete len:483 (+) Transcript_33190:361-1809(+)